jgi:arylsulfatase A-like enzyme
VGTAALAAGPNVLVIITDDQGYGDFGAHGNPVVRTPNLDRFFGESVKLDRFFVSPVCTPTRASLMTGRYNYRTRAIDTSYGRAMMDPAEVTLAEMLRGAGYRAAIFGKWHLGDNYPMRPIDQGFEEALVLKGGGLSQVSDPPESTGYFNPILQHNGRAEKVSGYCSDVYTDAALKYIAEPSHRPFFVYLAFNCPHSPYEIAESAVEPYRRENLKPARFPQKGYPFRKSASPEDVARPYAMITNIDNNLQRLFSQLAAQGLDQDTIVVFLTDNGPPQPRFNSGMHGQKGQVYDGGIRVPCYIRWPGHFAAGRVVDQITAHIDLTPTLIDACGVSPPSNVAFDGKSLLSLLRGDSVDWPDRTLYAQWHRGDVPILYRAFSARSPQYKLVHAGPPEGSGTAAEQHFELFDMLKDPWEMHNLAAEHPEIVDRMRQGYEKWFADVSATRGYDPPPIVLGSSHENPTILTLQDWRGQWRAGIEGAVSEREGHWRVAVERAGNYEIKLQFDPRSGPTTAHFQLGEVAVQSDIEKGATTCTFERVHLPAGSSRLQVWTGNDSTRAVVKFVDVKRLDDGTTK